MDFDVIVKEWFYRLPKGYADAPYTEEELAVLDEVLNEHGVVLTEVDELDQAFLDAEPVEDIDESVIEEEIENVTKDDIIDQIRKSDLSKSDLMKLNQFIITTTFKPQVIDYLSSKNISSENYQIGEEAVNIILTKITSLPNAADVIDYFETPVDLTWDSNGRGNIQKLTGLPDSTIARLITIQPGADRGGNATGPAEIAFSLLFKNIKNATGGGDLELDGKTVELKGKDGRLGSQSGRGKELNLRSSFIGRMVEEGPNYDYTVFEEAMDFFDDANNVNIAHALFNAYSILVKRGTMPEDEFMSKVQTGLSNIYFDKTSVVEKYINDNTKWSSVDSIGRQLVKINLEAYMSKINNDIIIFHRFRETGRTASSDLSFVVIDKDDIDSVIDSGIITLGSQKSESSILWHNTNPSVKLNI
jgi:hypothetical protein